jgi:hypothetical protein
MDVSKLIFSRELGKKFTKYTAVKQIINSRLRKENLTKFEIRLLSTFHELAKEIYESVDDSFHKCRQVFEDKFVDYCYEVNEYIQTFIENVVEEMVFKKDIGYLETPQSVFKLRRMFREKQGAFMTVQPNSDDEC